MRTIQPKGVRQRRVVPIHPLLFAAFPLLALYQHNLNEASFAQIVQPLGLALLGTLVIWAALTLVLRGVRKAAIGASAIAMAYLSYGHVVRLTPGTYSWIIAPACILGILAIFASLWRTRQPLLDATSILNVAAGFLVAMSCWSIGAGLWRSSHLLANDTQRHVRQDQPGSKDALTATRSRRVIGPVSSKSADLPDVYYIVLDAYARADSLRAFYGYDNTGFIRALESRGFYVAAKSRANYDQTPLCLASALNMTYLDAVAKRSGTDCGMEMCRRMLDDNAVAACLAPLGYHYVAIGSYDGEAKVLTADLVLNRAEEIPVLTDQALMMTPAGPHSPVHRIRFDQHRKRLLGVFSSLETVARLPYKKFVFAHLLAPHPPFVFDGQGGPVYPVGALNFADASWLREQITGEQYVHGYVAQLQYVNRRILDCIDAILSQSARPPIIIIQGDHGSRMTLDWDSLQRTDVRETFANLNAYLVPTRVRKHLYSTISGVNSFRVVLSDLFGADYKRIPDRSLYSTVGQPFEFTDITARTAKLWDGAFGAPSQFAPGHPRQVR